MKSIKVFLTSFVITALVIFAVLYTTGFAFPDPDGFYHAKMSQLVTTGEIADKFEWMPLTSWGQSFANQHLFYHILLKPFTSINTLPWSVIIFGALAATMFIALIQKVKIKFWGFWLLMFLFASVDFLFRISLVKANTLSLVILFSFAWVLLDFNKENSNRSQKFYLGLTVILSAVFLSLYGGFVFLPLFGGLYFLVHLIIKKELVWFIPVGILFGFGIALLFHPHQSILISHLYDQIFHTGLGAGSKVPAGGEWMAYDFAWFARSNLLILLAFGLSISVLFSHLKTNKDEIKNHSLQLSLLLFSLVLLVLTLFYRRFIEYFAPFTLLFIAVTLSPYLRRINRNNLKLALSSYQGIVALSVFAIVVISSLAFNAKQVYDSFRNQPSGYEYKASSRWMQENSNPGEIIFNTQWDEFPQLFYWNDHNHYIVGMDPTFFYIANPDLYWQWRIVADDDKIDSYSLEEIHHILTKDFGAKFLFIDKSRNPNLWLKVVNEDLTTEYFTVGYEDDLVIVFGVN